MSVKFEDIISDKLFQLVHIPSDHLIPIVKDKKEESFSSLSRHSSFGKRERRLVLFYIRCPAQLYFELDNPNVIPEIIVIGLPIR